MKLTSKKYIVRWTETHQVTVPANSPKEARALVEEIRKDHNQSYKVKKKAAYLVRLEK